MNKRRFTIITVLAIFVLVFMVTSPMPTGKMPLSLENPSIVNNVVLSDTYTVASDVDDCYYEDESIEIGDSYCLAYYYHRTFPPADIKIHSYVRWSLDIPAGATITSATLTIYVEIAGGGGTLISRVDETNVGSLEGDSSMPSVTATNAVEMSTLFDALGWRTSDSLVNIVQDQIDLGGWSSGYYIGLNLAGVDTGGEDANRFEDYSDAMEHRSYLSIEWEPANEVPVNDQTPICTNLDDTDNLYARYRRYEYSVSVTDGDGYADLNYVELRSYDYGTTTLRWAVRYDEDTNAFTEQSGASYIDLTGSTYSKSGVNLDITFKLYIEWAHPNAGDDDLYQYVCDDHPSSDADSYNSNYDYETRLDLSAFSLSDGSGTVDRGNYNSLDTITASGTVIYYGSGNNYPASTHVDVWVLCTDVAGGPWSDLTLSSGAFSMTVDSDDIVGLDTYTFKVVLEGAGASAGDQLHATHTDTYIADNIVMRNQFTVEYYVDPDVEDNRVRYNAWTKFYVWLEYEYDDSIVSNGVVHSDATPDYMDEDLTYQGADGKWGWQYLHAEGGPMMYSMHSMTVSGNTHGITTLTNHSQYDLIFDRVRVVSYTFVSGDDWVSTGTTVTMDVELHWDYDETDVTTGTVTVNGISATYQSLGKWRFSDSEASVTLNTYNTVVSDNNEYGITGYELNTVTQQVLWDRLVFTIVADDDTPLGGVQVTFTVTAIYDYDDSTCSTYDIWISRGATNQWTEITSSPFYDTNVKGTTYAYDVYSVVSSGEGITTFTSTGESVTWGNNFPTNDQTPICTNLDDTDNLYGRYKLYEFSVSISEPDGYADVNYIELRLYNYGTTTLRWTVRYTESTNAFTEVSGASYIELTGSTYSKSGTNLDVTFKLWIEWGHGDWSDEDLYQYVIDDSAASDADSYDSNYDFETRLSISGFNMQDYDGYDLNYWSRGGISEAVYAIGTLVYYGSALHPNSAGVDVWVFCTDVASSPWGDTTLTSGAFNVTAESDDVVGLDTYTVKAVANGAGSGGTDLIGSGTQSDTFISDAIEIFEVFAGDTHIGIGSTGYPYVRARYAYGPETIYGGASIYMQKDDSGSPDTLLSNIVSNLWRGDIGVSTVQTRNYTMHSVSGSYYGIEHYVLTASPSYAQITWDRTRALAIQTQYPTGRINTDTVAWIQVQFDYESALYGWITGFNTYPTITGPSGSVTLNDYQGDGWWRGTCTSTTGNDFTFNTNTLNNWIDSDTVTARTKGAYTNTTHWDRIVVLGYATDSSDNRDNVDTLYNISVWLQYESDSTNVTDGTVVVNGNSTVYLSGGNWTFTISKSVVCDATFDTVVVSGNTYGITNVDQNSKSVFIIWDRIKFLTIAMVNGTGVDVTHGEVNVGDGVEVRITAELEYDNHVVGSGDMLYLLASPDLHGSSEWFALSWDAVNSWLDNTKTESSDVNLWLFSAHSHDAYEATYGITVVNTNSISDWAIWDRVLITNTWITDGHINADSNSTVWITCEMEYWFEKGGTEWVRDFNGDSMYLNGTLMTYDDEDRWYIDTLEYSSNNHSFIVTSGFWDEWDITVVENATYVYICWDRVEITSLSINLQWTVVGYNATISYTADYEISVDTWAGVLIFNGTAGTRFPSEPVYGNYTFTPTLATDPSEGITVVLVSDTLVWCIFDDAIVTSTAYYWVQFSVNKVWLIWESGTWTWAVNDTTLDTGAEDVAKVRSYMNGTDDDWGIVNGDGLMGNLIVGPFDTSWYYVNLTMNCETMIDGISYDWQVWGVVLSVDILHSIHITDSGMDVQDVWVTFIFHSNWGNASFTIWDNDTIVGHSGSEGWYQIAKPSTVGLHNYTVLINGTHGTASQSGQTKDFSLSDSWAWRNFKFTVNPVALEITNWRIEVSSTEVSGGGYISKDADVYIYEDPEKDGSFALRSTTSVSGLGTFSFYWTRYEASEVGDVRYAVKFINASSTWWENGTYARAVSVSFAVDLWWLDLDLGGQSPMVEGYIKTSWENATIQVYDNNTLQITASEGEGGVFFYWWMSEVQGLHEITLNITSGSTTFTRSRTYYVPDWAVSGLVVRWDMWTYQNNYTLLTLESNWRNCTYHIYLDGFEVANASVDPVTLNFTRSINVGEYNLTIFADGGTQNYTILNIRYIVTEDGVTYDYSEVTTSHGVANNYETNVVNNYTNPPGVYATVETIALIIVGLLLGSVVVFMIVSRWLAVWRAKFATKYT